jgi:hypothetical protein
VEVWKGTRGSVGPESKQKSKLTTTGSVDSGARKAETRGGYRPGASQAASPERRANKNHGMGGKVVGDVRQSFGQWRMAVHPRACARRPRVAGLGVGGVSCP